MKFRIPHINLNVARCEGVFFMIVGGYGLYSFFCVFPVKGWGSGWYAFALSVCPVLLFVKGATQFGESYKGDGGSE